MDGQPVLVSRRDLRLNRTRDVRTVNRDDYRDVPALPEVGEIDLNAVLERKGPLELEIGFGTGRFLLDRAQTNPHVHIVGIETRRKLVSKVADKAARRDLDNAAVFYGDALKMLPRMFPDRCLERVFVNFPDPWWKKRHAKRLLLVPKFVAEVERLLERGGDLFVQTDVDFRAGQYVDLLSLSKRLVPVGENGYLSENPFDARSPREIRCEEAGLAIYRILFRKSD